MVTMCAEDERAIFINITRPEDLGDEMPECVRAHCHALRRGVIFDGYCTAADSSFDLLPLPRGNPGTCMTHLNWPR